MDELTVQLVGVSVSAIVSLAVGFGGARLGNRHALRMFQLQRKEDRYRALVGYEKALRDEAFYLESTLGEGSGAHAKPAEGALDSARTHAYEYLNEFEGHQKHITLQSPYGEFDGPNAKDDAMTFYIETAQLLTDHLRKHPTEPKQSPYLPKER